MSCAPLLLPARLAGLISSGSLDNLPDKRKLMVEMAIGNCDRLVRLVNDILDFDSVEKGRLPLNRRALDAGALPARGRCGNHGRRCSCGDSD